MKIADLKYDCMDVVMSISQTFEAIMERRQWIKDNEEGLSLGVTNILTCLLNYVEENITIPDEDSLTIVNQVFNLSVMSTQSTEAEKKFYIQAYNLLEQMPDKNNPFRTLIQPVIQNQQITHMWQLEQFSPEYDHAVKGMASSFTALGVMLSVLTYNPNWYIFFSIFLLAKILPSAASLDSSSEHKPSILGDLVYRHDELRNLGNTLHNNIYPQNSSQNGLSLFSKAHEERVTYANTHQEHAGTTLN